VQIIETGMEIYCILFIVFPIIL